MAEILLTSMMVGEKRVIDIIYDTEEDAVTLQKTDESGERIRLSARDINQLVARLREAKLRINWG